MYLFIYLFIYSYQCLYLRCFVQERKKYYLVLCGLYLIPIKWEPTAYLGVYQIRIPEFKFSSSLQLRCWRVDDSTVRSTHWSVWMCGRCDRAQVRSMRSRHHRFVAALCAMRGMLQQLGQDRQRYQKWEIIYCIVEWGSDSLGFWNWNESGKKEPQECSFSNHYNSRC